jgi:hypothetical protein
LSVKHQRFIRQTFANRQCRAPLVTQDIQANAAIAVDVGMIYPCGKVDFWRLEWVVGGKVYREEKDTARVARIGLFLTVSDLYWVCDAVQSGWQAVMPSATLTGEVAKRQILTGPIIVACQ